MALQAVRSGRAPDEFSRLHGAFVEHFAYAVAFVWLASIYAAVHAPWVRNIRGLINPLGRVESTWSFLFALPLLMTAAWVSVAVGGESIRRAQLLKNQAHEFTIAGAIAFVVFCLAIDRAVTAYLLAF